MSRAPWTCLTSSCQGVPTVTTTERAQTEGHWRVVADCAACGRAHIVTKHLPIGLLSTVPT